MGKNGSISIIHKWDISEVTTCGHIQENWEEYQTCQFIMEDQAKSYTGHHVQWINNVKTFIMFQPAWAVIYILDHPCQTNTVTTVTEM
jgi:hypothetical protein